MYTVRTSDKQLPRLNDSEVAEMLGLRPLQGSVMGPGKRGLAPRVVFIMRGMFSMLT